MDRAQARLPNLSLDPKRIAATSAAIAVHAAALMLLMLPAQTAPPRPVAEIPMIVTPEFKTIPPIIPVTPPRPPTAVVPRPRPVPQPAAMASDQSTSPVDQVAETPLADDKLVIDNYAPEPPAAFAQISADVAPPPPYPAQALRLGQSGVVTLKVRVDAQGRPREAVIEGSSGSRVLDEAARKFVLARWHFIAATQGGVPIEAYALVPISFVIDR